jgi:uncharacterized protein YcbX
MGIHLTAINVYPIKSARGLSMDEWETDDFGLRYDRRWMVVDESGQFISQRDHPRMTLVVPNLVDGMLLVDAPGMPTLELVANPGSTVSTSVTVWNDTCEASWLGEGAARWFSKFLGCSCSLVYMGQNAVRPADPEYAASGTRVSFADAFPFLLISQESLSDLNRRLAKPLPMNRFRPNLLVAGGAPYDEDQWRLIQIGSVKLRLVKPCARCVVTTTDQVTAERGLEPLRTLATYRKVGGEVMFGQNAVHEGRGGLRVGDEVLVRERSAAGP